jgi:uncharacterized protein
MVTVPDLGGMSIEQFSLALANRWGLGRADLDNGVLVLVAPKERRVRVAVGCGLEQVLTDGAAAAIIERMTPLLAAGEYDRALALAFDDVEATLRARPERQRAP